MLARVASIDQCFVATLAALLRESASPSLDRSAAAWTTDSNTATGIREATLDEIMTGARQALSLHVRKGTVFSSPKITANYLTARLAQHPYEVFTLIYLDDRHRFIAADDLFRGTIDGATVHPREVVKQALNHNAAAVIIAHTRRELLSRPLRMKR